MSSSISGNRLASETFPELPLEARPGETFFQWWIRLAAEGTPKQTDAFLKLCGAKSCVEVEDGLGFAKYERDPSVLPFIKGWEKAAEITGIVRLKKQPSSEDSIAEFYDLLSSDAKHEDDLIEFCRLLGCMNEDEFIARYVAEPDEWNEEEEQEKLRALQEAMQGQAPPAQPAAPPRAPVAPTSAIRHAPGGVKPPQEFDRWGELSADANLPDTQTGESVHGWLESALDDAEGDEEGLDEVLNAMQVAFPEYAWTLDELRMAAETSLGVLMSLAEQKRAAKPNLPPAGEGGRGKMQEGGKRARANWQQIATEIALPGAVPEEGLDQAVVRLYEAGDEASREELNNYLKQNLPNYTGNTDFSVVVSGLRQRLAKRGLGASGSSSGTVKEAGGSDGKKPAETFNLWGADAKEARLPHAKAGENVIIYLHRVLPKSNADDVVDDFAEAFPEYEWTPGKLEDIVDEYDPEALAERTPEDVRVKRTAPAPASGGDQFDNPYAGKALKTVKLAEFYNAPARTLKGETFDGSVIQLCQQVYNMAPPMKGIEDLTSFYEKHRDEWPSTVTADSLAGAVQRRNDGKKAAPKKAAPKKAPAKKAAPKKAAPKKSPVKTSQYMSEDELSEFFGLYADDDMILRTCEKTYLWPRIPAGATVAEYLALVKGLGLKADLVWEVCKAISTRLSRAQFDRFYEEVVPVVPEPYLTEDQKSAVWQLPVEMIIQYLDLEALGLGDVVAFNLQLPIQNLAQQVMVDGTALEVVVDQLDGVLPLQRGDIIEHIESLRKPEPEPEPVVLTIGERARWDSLMGHFTRSLVQGDTYDEHDRDGDFEKLDQLAGLIVEDAGEVAAGFLNQARGQAVAYLRYRLGHVKDLGPLIAPEAVPCHKLVGVLMGAPDEWKRMVMGELDSGIEPESA